LSDEEMAKLQAGLLPFRNGLPPGFFLNGALPPSGRLGRSADPASSTGDQGLRSAFSSRGPLSSRAPKSLWGRAEGFLDPASLGSGAPAGSIFTPSSCAP
jgi:hypothetical protein